MSRAGSTSASTLPNEIMKPCCRFMNEPCVARVVSPDCRRAIKMERANILGVGVSAINMDLALYCIDSWIQRREPNYVIAVPAHCIVECLKDERLRNIYNGAGMVTPDGRPIVWITRLMGF